MANKNPDSAIEAEISRARQSLQAGDFAAAQSRLDAALKSDPQNAEALHLAGVGLFLQGKADAASEFFRRAIDANPRSAKSHYNLGLIHNGCKDHEEAVQCLRRAVELDRDDPDAWGALGHALAACGKRDEAIDAYKRAIVLDGQNAETHNDLGTVYGKAGQLDEAAFHFRKAVELDPGHATGHNNLGIALGNLARQDEAVSHFRRAIEIKPDYAEAHNNLGTALKELGRFDEAIAHYREAISINPGNAEAHGNLGAALGELGQQDEAIAQFRRAIELDPGYAKGHGNLGTVLGELGRRDEAITHFRKAITINPAYAEMHRHLAFIRKHSMHDDDIKAMEKLIELPDVGDEQKAHLAFGLGKSYEDLKQYEKAFEFFAMGNALKRKSIGSGLGRWEGLFGALKQTFDQALFETRSGAGFPDETPIFVLGMPRSGTTLVEQILASHPEVHAAGELNTLGETIAACFGQKKYPGDLPDMEDAQLTRLGERYVGALRETSETARFITDKLPHNFVHIGLIRLILPKAKIIHCKRDPQDNCLSIFKTYFSRDAHSYAYDQVELGQYYKLYLDLMEHWYRVLPGVIHDVQYEDLVADQKAQTRALLEHCGLEWHDDCLKFYETERAVKTASAAQVREPIYKGSVQSWKRYEKQLAPLFETLR